MLVILGNYPDHAGADEVKIAIGNCLLVKRGLCPLPWNRLSMVFILKRYWNGFAGLQIIETG
jgi:hypothetical protein